MHLITGKNSSFEIRLLRRIFLVSMSALVLIAILTGYSRITSTMSALAASHEAGLEIISSHLGEELELIFKDVTRLASAPNTRQFASAAAAADSQGGILARAQTAMVNEFLNTATKNKGYYAIRYVMRDGSIWGAVVTRFGINHIDRQLHPQALATNPDFQRSRFAQNDQVVVGSFVPQLSDNGVPLVPTTALLTVYAPVAAGSTILGYVEIDIVATPLLDLVNRAMSGGVEAEEGRRMILIDEKGQIVADSGAPRDANLQLDGLVNSAPLETALYDSLDTFVQQNPVEINQRTLDNYLVSTRRFVLGSSPNPIWHLIFVDDTGVVFGRAYGSVAAIVVGILAVGVILNLVLFWTIRPLTRPLKKAHALAQKLASEQQDLQEFQGDSRQGDDEVIQMALAIERISRYIQDLTTNLNRQVARRTRDLEIAARIGREATTLHDIDQVVRRAIDLICDELGYYHAQVFLVDDIGANAVLVYSRGEIGQQLLAQNHKITLGSGSVVGQAGQTGEPVIVNDVTGQTGKTHGFNPLLFRTRAEMALPLRVGDRITGVLDIQSTSANAFKEESLPTFELLAGQLAVAIENARLITQSEQRVQQITRLDQQQTRKAWGEIKDKVTIQQAYEYNLLKVTQADPSRPAGGLSAPINVRGVRIGEINASVTEGLAFTENDEILLRAVADRVAYAIENARLFQETQFTLAETSQLYQLSQKLNEASTLTDIIRAILESVTTNASSGQIWVFDEYAAGQPEWMDLAADLVITPRPDDNGDSADLRVNLKGMRFLQHLHTNRITLVHDSRLDSRLDESLQAIFERLVVRAAMIVPLVIRGAWRGLIVIGYAEPREFGEAEGRIYSTLIDQAGVAIDNSLLLQQTETALARNENLYAASRIINTAQNLQDLVYAVITAAGSSAFNYWLGLLEGELDETGWPTRSRIVAYSENGEVYEASEVHAIHVDQYSPLRRREVEVIVDNQPDPTPRMMWMREHGIKFLAVFPLFGANQPIAAFYVLSSELRELSDADYEVYNALTGQISIQLENRRLLARTEQALDETRRLYVASRAIASAQDIEMVFYTTADHLARPFRQTANEPAQRTVRIAILQARPRPTWDAPELEYVYSWSSDPDEPALDDVGRRVDNADGALNRLIEAYDGVVYLPDIQANPAGQPDLPPILQPAVSALVTPVQTRGKWFGAIVCRSDQPNDFDEQYQRFVQAIVDQVALALENKQLFEEAQQEAQRAQQEARRALALAEAGQLAGNIGEDFERNIGEVFARVAESAGYDHWLLALLDSTQERLDVVTIQARPVKLASELGLPTSFPIVFGTHSLVDAVYENRAIVVNDPAGYPAFAELDAEYHDLVGKHIAIPVDNGVQILGALLVGRGLDDENLDDRDEQLIRILASQIGVALENRRLFEAAEVERQRLQSILSTLPAGVLVLDPVTYEPITFNEKAGELLGHMIERDRPFSAQDYNIYRTGTRLHYPDDELPIFVTLKTGRPSFTDDVAVEIGDHRVDLLVNAAPIRSPQGEITAVVAAFEDISNLRRLENTLQENLRETVALYEAQRSLSEAGEIDEVLDVILAQMILVQPSDAYILLTDESGDIQIARQMVAAPENLTYHAGLLNPVDAVHIYDIQTHPNLEPETRQAVAAANIQSLLSIPLRVRSLEKPMGWLVVVSAEPFGFSPDQERMLSTICDVAATALDNRYLFQNTQRAYQESIALYNITTAVSRALDIDELGKVIRTALETLKPDLYAAYVDPGGGSLQEFFNIAQDSAPIDFQSLLRHRLADDHGVYIEDLGSMPAGPLADDLRALGNIQAFAMVNLRVKDLLGGRLFLAYHRPHQFDEGDMRYLNALVDSVSLRLDNILLLDQIQTTLEETSTLYQASRVLSDVSSPEGVLEVVVNYLINEQTDQVFVGLLSGRGWDAAEAALQLVANWHARDDVSLVGVTLTPAQFPAWSKLASPNVIMIDDVQAEQDLDLMEQLGFESLDARSVVIMPLRVAQRAIGVIWISSSEAYHYSERELRIYQAFAEQASLSMEAANLLRQTERRARQLETSAIVGESIGRLLDLDVLLPELVNLIRDSFGYDHAQVFLMNKDGEWAELRASTGEAGRQLLMIRHRLQKGSDSVIGQVTATGRPSIALDTADARVVHRPNPYLPLTRSELALPLIIKGKVVGALDVQSNLPNAFSDADAQVLTILAGQIAGAIENANLFQQARSRASEMSFLFEVTTAAASASSLQEAIQGAADNLQRSLEALSVSIYLPQTYIDPDDNTYTVMQAVALAGSDQPLSEISEVRIDDADNYIGIVSASQQSALIHDITQEDRYVPIMPTAKSAVVVPMISGNELIGLIVMEDSRPAAYDDSTRQLVLTLAGSLSAVIQSARLLEQLTKVNEELRELDRLKSDFLANMSHELRTPLNSIIGFSRVMLKGIDGALTEMQEQDLTTIYNSGQHLLMLINDILDQAKIASGKMDLKKSYFEVKPMIEGVRSIGIGLLKDKPIDMVVEIAPTVGTVYGDEFRTRQALLNLVSNATKFTKEGQIIMRVYPEKDESGRDFVRVDVIDTGIGIAEKDLPLLFEAFRQIDSSLTRTQGGTGLGLPISKSLIEMQGGRMTVSSQVNVGSTFSFTIPVKPVEADDAESGEAADEAPQKDDTLHLKQPNPVKHETMIMRTVKPNGPPPKIMQMKRQVLLVEDNPDMVDQFRRTIQREGFEVFTATIPLEAEAMASGLRPTVIVMDVNFAGGRGWDILKSVKNRDDTFDIPVVVVTLSDEADRAHQLGVHRFIQRPFTPDELVSAVLEAEKESNTERILIIDDQPESVRLLKDMLDQHGSYRVFAANTGPEGIALVARRRPDLIILDLRMPEMDGFAVLQELRSNPETANIPVMVVTGDILTADEQVSLENIHVLQKTDISQEAYEQFVTTVQNHLSGFNGGST